LYLLLVVIVVLLLARVVDLCALLPAARLDIIAILVSIEGFLLFLFV
jgi:hypothetical protein